MWVISNPTGPNLWSLDYQVAFNSVSWPPSRSHQSTSNAIHQHDNAIIRTMLFGDRCESCIWFYCTRILAHLSAKSFSTLPCIYRSFAYNMSSSQHYLWIKSVLCPLNSLIALPWNFPENMTTTPQHVDGHVKILIVILLFASSDLLNLDNTG